MKEKFQGILDKYYDKIISLEEFIFNINLLHREKLRIDTESLKSKLHPKLQEILPELIKKVEKKTNLIYYGIVDGIKDKDPDLHHYYIEFQHVYSFKTMVDISVGQCGSCSGKYFVRDDNKIHLGVYTPGFQAVWGECNLNDKNLMKNLLSSIIKFNEEYGQIY